MPDSAPAPRKPPSSQEAGDELAGETIVLDEMDLMATTVFEQLLDPAYEMSKAIEADLQNDDRSDG